MTTVGQRIRALREMHDINQADLAEVTGLARTSITNLEAGRQNIQLGTLEAIAKHFGVSMAALLGEADLPLLPKVSIITTCEVHCDQCGRLLLGDQLTAAQAADARHEHISVHLNSKAVNDNG